MATSEVTCVLCPFCFSRWTVVLSCHTVPIGALSGAQTWSHSILDIQILKHELNKLLCFTRYPASGILFQQHQMNQFKSWQASSNISVHTPVWLEERHAEHGVDSHRTEHWEDSHRSRSLLVKTRLAHSRRTTVPCQLLLFSPRGNRARGTYGQCLTAPPCSLHTLNIPHELT